MNIEKLLDLARQHVEEIKTKKAHASACLPDDVLLSQLDDDDPTSLESILDTSFKPTDDPLGIQVSIYSATTAFSLSQSIILHIHHWPPTNPPSFPPTPLKRTKKTPRNGRLMLI